MDIIDTMNRVCDGVGRALFGDDMPFPDLFGVRQKMVNGAMEREYKDLIDNQHKAISKHLSALEQKDREIAQLLDRLNRSLEISPDKPQIPQIAAFLKTCAEGAKDTDTAQGMVDALLLNRAAAALESDPCAECFTEEFKATYFLPNDLEESPVRPVTAPKTNGGRLRAMDDYALAVWLVGFQGKDFGEWMDWLGGYAE